jgi:CheY-like chemotaxis protein
MTRRYGGTGLGMSIVRRLIDMMGGTLELTSEVGQGTRVSVTLPLPLAQTTDQAVLPATAPAVPAAPNLQGRRILAADDNEVNLDVLSAMLEDTGATLVLAGNGEQAVQAYVAEAFDILLLDISMPVMDGPTALRHMAEIAAREGRPMPPAIAFTANLMPHQIADHLAAGFVDVIAKPVKRKILLDQIERYLDGADQPGA